MKIPMLDDRTPFLPHKYVMLIFPDNNTTTTTTTAATTSIIYIAEG
jgi:hypothetical protein